MFRVGSLELLLVALILGLPIVIGIVLLITLGRRRRRMPPGGQGQERVVERQVLVQRCRFCGKLTPVDLSACAECGAKL